MEFCCNPVILCKNNRRLLNPGASGLGYGKTMVFTLHRYIFRELFKVFLLATVALTLIASMGSMYRPIQKYGVGPQQVFQLLGYFLPIMLTFVLPMSALFAASLVYGRFASDNELDACRASGISFTTVMYPGLFLGVLVSITTLVLSFHVVPAFVHRAERTIKANAEQILFRNIQRKGYYAIPDNRYRVFADHASAETDTLQGVVIIETRDGGVTKLITADAARIEFETQKNFNEVTITAKDVFQIDKHGRQAYMASLPVRSTFASLLTDDIKFQRIDDIKRIQADKLHFYPIREVAYRCRAQLAIEMLAEQIRRTLSAGQYFEFVGKDRKVLFTAAGCTATSKDYIVELEGPIVLVELHKDLGTVTARWDCQRGRIQLESADRPDATLDLILDSPRHDRGDFKGIAQKHVIKYLPLPRNIEEILTEDRLLETIASLDSETPPVAEPSETLRTLKRQVSRKIERTELEIGAEVHSRLVFGLGCSLLIMAGIALGVVFKGGHLLTAFGASSIPAAALIIFIMTGKEMTKNPSMSMMTGIMVMWAGLVVLGASVFFIYRRLLRT